MQQWNDKLISPERVFGLTANWPVYAVIREGNVYLDCHTCGQAVTRLIGSEHHGTGYLTHIEGLAAVVLRHMVTHHDQSLSATGGTNGGGSGAAEAGQAQHGGDPDRDRRGGAHPGDRPVHQEADPARGSGIQGGNP